MPLPQSLFDDDWSPPACTTVLPLPELLLRWRPDSELKLSGDSRLRLQLRGRAIGKAPAAPAALSSNTEGALLRAPSESSSLSELQCTH
jgi:hypothetical protein